MGLNIARFFSLLFVALVLTIMVRHQPKVFGLTLAAFLCLLAAHGLFWIFTFPANQATSNWTTLPENWTALRAQWEYSHAAGAVLNLVAFIMLVLSMLPSGK